MDRFYVTYQFRYRNLRNCYTEIEALDYIEARDIVISARGSDWACLYSAEKFAGQPEKYKLTPVELHQEGFE